VTLDWKIFGWIVAGIAALGLWLYVGQIRTEREQFRAERDKAISQVRALAQDNAGLKVEIEANAKAVKVRESKRAALEAENEALRGQLGGIYENDSASRAWRDGPCPDGVIECLRP
jgi:hypothetical protein